MDSSRMGKLGTPFMGKLLNKETLEDYMATHLISIYLCFVAIATDFSGFFHHHVLCHPFVGNMAYFQNDIVPSSWIKMIMSQIWGRLTRWGCRFPLHPNHFQQHRIYRASPGSFLGLQTVFFEKPKHQEARRQSSSKSRPCTLDRVFTS